jgi:restriction system protein
LIAGQITPYSDFSAGATEYARSLSDKVIHIDGQMLANLMIDHGAGVSTQRSYEIKRVDSDHFSEA